MSKTLLGLALLFSLVGCGAVDVEVSDDDVLQTQPPGPTPRPDVCLADADCTDPLRGYCVDGACVECDGAAACDPSAPVCDAGHACTGCTNQIDCAGYADAPVCGDDGACRGCALDTECTSGACDFATGACYAEAEVVYVTSGGTTSGACGSVTLPCGSLAAAAPRVSASRPVVRMIAGMYNGQIVPASPVPMIVHAAGVTIRATSTSNNVGVFTTTGADVTIYDAAIEVTASAGATFRGVDVGLGTRVVLERGSIRVTGSPGTGIESEGTLIVRRFDLQSTGLAIGSFSGSIDLSASRITASNGVFVGAPSFGITNNLFAFNRTAALVIDSPIGASKSITFNTFLANGQLVASGATELDIQRVEMPGTLRFSTLYNIYSNARPYTGSTGPRLTNANVAHSLLDQPNLPGDPNNTNLYLPAGLDTEGRLTQASPAIDAITSTAGLPATDRDGDARPAGNGYDIGADEWAP